jgi:hypothetical protein
MLEIEKLYPDIMKRAYVRPSNPNSRTNTLEANTQTHYQTRKRADKKESDTILRVGTKMVTRNSEKKRTALQEIENGAYKDNKRCRETNASIVPLKKCKIMPNQKKEGTITIFSLPDDILKEIFKNLDVGLVELCQLKLVCRKWCILLSEEKLFEGRFMFSDSQESVLILLQNEVLFSVVKRII